LTKSLLTLLWTCSTLFGAAILFTARRLSLRYNAWTTAMRTRHPNINPPPTPKMRELNTKIMTWLIRFLGAWIFMLSVFELFLVRVRS
jgi:hypothetical protein